jgi:hypothetical protein
MKRLVIAGLIGAALTVPAAAQAAPAPKTVTVTCDVYAQQFGNMLASFAGTVHGVGPNYAAARANAESKIWGPYGSMPYVANCR